MTQTVTAEPSARSSLRSRRWLLWGALLLLVGALLGVLVFLAGEYEEARDQEALERDAATLVGDIRSGLVRNVQDILPHQVPPILHIEGAILTYPCIGLRQLEG